VINGRWIKNKGLHIAYATGREISGVINLRKKKGKKNILLYCNSQTMEEHLLNFMEQLEDCPEYVCYLRFGRGYAAGKRQKKEETLFYHKEVNVIENTWKLYFMRWSLIVCADLEHPFWIKKGTIPTMYIGHGSGGVSYDNGETTYDYSKDSLDKNGKPMFDIMLEPNKETAKFMKKDPVYGKTIRSAGYRFAYKLKDASMEKEKYREQLGIRAEKKVVSIWGSWNRESLFHVLGPELFEVCKELKKNGYEFVFSIHPREYIKYDENIQPLGEIVEKQRDEGFLVRSPQDDWLPYMIASDVVVVDYSAMFSLAVLAGKKIVLSDFPDGKVWKKSMHYKIKKIFPVISHASELGAALQEVESTDKYDKEIQRFQEQLYVSQEDYKKFIRNVVSELINN